MKKAIGTMVATIGGVVGVGWLLDMDVLKSIHGGWVSMKMATALMFVASGVILYRTGSRRTAPGTLNGVLSVGILGWSAIIVCIAILEPVTGIKTLPFHRVDSGPYTSIPGMPSAASLFSFMLVAAYGIEALFIHNARWIPVSIGAVLTLVGVVGMLGYAVDEPMMYYYFGERSSAMAVHTAALFTLLGAGMMARR